MEPGYGTEFRPDERSKDQAIHEDTLGQRDGSYDPGFHSENLYDQNEGAGGEVIDLRTGNPVDNSTETDARLVQKQGGYISDGLAALKEEDDEAARWLAEHDEAA